MLLGKEGVTVPAGTFTACKFQTTIEQNSGMAGVSTRTQLSGIHWTRSQWRRVKRQDSGMTTVNAFGINTTSDHVNTHERPDHALNPHRDTARPAPAARAGQPGRRPHATGFLFPAPPRIIAAQHHAEIAGNR